MYKSILVATDGSKLSARAVAHAVGLAKSLGARLTAFYATPEYSRPMRTEGVGLPPMSRSEYALLCKAMAARVLDPVEKKASAAGVDVEAAMAQASTPWKAILDAAAKHRCDVIVMASHGRHGVAALLLGSETQKVLAYSKVPVIVVR